MSSLRFNTYEIDDTSGYGIVAKHFLKALERYSDLDLYEYSKNILNFCKAEHYEFGNVTVGYTPWESTKVPSNWVEPMKRVDDLWTTSQWVADIFKNETSREAFVLPHGISEEWTPIRHHRKDGPFTFVHVGEPAIRKGGDIVLQTWFRHFRDNNDVQLVFKCRGHTTGRIYDSDGSIMGSAYNVGNIRVIDETYNLAEMWRLYILSDCMVYPSRGEGFGLIPFEAMACALPTILPAHAIGDFKRYGIPLWHGDWEKSLDQRIHPGNWRTFDEDEIIFQMETTLEDYENRAFNAYANAKKIHDEYSWKSIINSALARLDPILP